MLITVGMFTYTLIASCLGLGGVGYPPDDTVKDAAHRVIIVCTDLGPDQARQVYVHELIHACLHNHNHHFNTQKELEAHINTVKEQSEEALVDTVSACMVSALENKDALRFLGIESDSDNRSCGGSVFSRARKTNAKDKLRYSGKQCSGE